MGGAPCLCRSTSTASKSSSRRSPSTMACRRITSSTFRPVSLLLAGYRGEPRSAKPTTSARHYDDSGTWLPVPISLGLESESGTVNAHVSYSLLGVETRATPLRHARLGSTLMIAGAIPLQYDGVRLTEYGFLSEPHVSSYITPDPTGAFAGRQNLRLRCGLGGY